MTALLRLGDRVRLLGTRHLGTVVANPYQWHGVARVGVIWDRSPGTYHCLDLADVARVGVPPEARPLSVGAMAGGGR